MNWLETKYISLLTGRVRNYKRISNNVFNFSCPLCGDSQSNKRKARGYITEKKGNIIYTCHNGCGSMLFRTLLQRVDNELYSEYQKERITAGLWIPGSQRKAAKPADKDTLTEGTIETSAPPLAVSRDPLLLLTRIDKLPPDHYARVFVENRKLPDIKKFYHCPLFYSWVNTLIPKKFNEKLCTPTTDHPRLIIPFHNRPTMLPDVFAFQGRAYGDSSVKYITIRLDEGVEKIYGLDRLDVSRLVYAFEGPLDSEFIPNSIAFAGGDHSSLSAFDPKRTTIVYDNEKRSPQTRHKLLKAIRAGFGVVIWSANLPFKDVNEMVQKGLEPSIIKQIIDECTYRGLAAENELSFWSKT